MAERMNYDETDRPADNRAKVAFDDPRKAALAVLNSGCRLTIGAGKFLGQMVAVPRPMTEQQEAWMNVLLGRAGFRPFISRGSQ